LPEMPRESIYLNGYDRSPSMHVCTEFYCPLIFPQNRLLQITAMDQSCLGQSWIYSLTNIPAKQCIKKITDRISSVATDSTKASYRCGQPTKTLRPMSSRATCCNFWPTECNRLQYT